ncbi:MAG: beta galactosidase jelly roll domain-containing protein [Lachnospiraceae bacterium]|nr:beta galactosidase jelly roll domain-containing protein [Lachnospiraceae bacterium]
MSGKILVPFCPESKLSGVEFKDFMEAVWYRRTVTLTKEQTEGKVFLHFGAVDYRAEVFVNGKKAGSHKGGYISFRLDITGLVREGENVLTVHASDDNRDPMIPRGKQCEKYYSMHCD